MRNGAGVLTLPVLLVLAGCAHGPALCASGLAPMTEVRLFFGGSVPPDAWRDFLEREVSPRFPAGFSVFDAQGQWRGADGRIEQEGTRVFDVIVPDAAASTPAVAALRAAYKDRFHQQSVLLAEHPVCAGF